VAAALTAPLGVSSPANVAGAAAQVAAHGCRCCTRAFTHKMLLLRNTHTQSQSGREACAWREGIVLAGDGRVTQGNHIALPGGAAEGSPRDARLRSWSRRPQVAAASAAAAAGGARTKKPRTASLRNVGPTPRARRTSSSQAHFWAAGIEDSYATYVRPWVHEGLEGPAGASGAGPVMGVGGGGGGGRGRPSNGSRDATIRSLPQGLPGAAPSEVCPTENPKPLRQAHLSAKSLHPGGRSARRSPMRMQPLTGPLRQGHLAPVQPERRAAAKSVQRRTFLRGGRWGKSGVRKL
jgi:hypothetical protein